MIAIINSGTSLYGALAYNYIKVEEGTATIIHGNRIIDTLSNNKNEIMNDLIESFQPYLSANKRTSQPIVHISINPDLEDKLSDGDYCNIVDDYMQRMGFGNQPYIVFRHNDIDREHLHIVTVRVQEDGKKISDSHERIRNKIVCRELEKNYDLKQINNKEENVSSFYLKPLDYKKGNIKRQISNITKSLIQDYTFHSYGEFNALLSNYNVNSKYVKGMDEENPYHGIIYSGTNNKGDIIGIPIKSSRISKMVGYNEIIKRASIHKENLKPQKNPFLSKSIIKRSLDNSKSLRGFKTELKKYGLDVIYRINDEGRLYGITFIDHNKKNVFNGSRLGKEFSANNIGNILNQARLNKENKKDSPKKGLS